MKPHEQSGDSQCFCFFFSFLESMVNRNIPLMEFLQSIKVLLGLQRVTRTDTELEVRLHLVGISV